MRVTREIKIEIETATESVIEITVEIKIDPVMMMMIMGGPWVKWVKSKRSLKDEMRAAQLREQERAQKGRERSQSTQRQDRCSDSSVNLYHHL